MTERALVHSGLQALLSETEVTIDGPARNLQQARWRHRAEPADVAIVDLELPDATALHAVRVLRSDSPQLAVLLLADPRDPMTADEAVRLGASGLLHSSVGGQVLVDALRSAASGRLLSQQTLTRRLLDGLSPAAEERSRLECLSPVELRVLALVARGCTNREIGEQVGLAANTAKNHVSTILRKLEVQRRAEAAAYFIAHQGPLPSPVAVSSDSAGNALRQLAAQLPELDEELVPQVLRHAHEELRVLSQREQELHAQRLGMQRELSALDQERRHYRDLFWYAPVSCLLTDAAGVVSEANLAACELLGVGRGELIGAPLSSFVDEHDRANFRLQLGRLQSGRDLGEWRLRLRARAERDEHAIAVSAIAFPVLDRLHPAGAPGRRAGTLRWVLRTSSKDSAKDSA